MARGKKSLAATVIYNILLFIGYWRRLNSNDIHFREETAVVPFATPTRDFLGRAEYSSYVDLDSQ